MDKKKKLTNEELKDALTKYEEANLFHYIPAEKSEENILMHSEWIETYKSKLGVKIIDKMNNKEYMRFKIGELNFIILDTYLQKRSINNFKIDLDYKIKKGNEINIFSA